MSEHLQEIISGIQKNNNNLSNVLNNQFSTSLLPKLNECLDFSGIVQINTHGLENSGLLCRLQATQVVRQIDAKTIDFNGHNFLSVVDENVSTTELLEQIIVEINVLNDLLTTTVFFNLSDKEKLLFAGALNQLKNNFLVLLNAVFYQEKSGPLVQEMVEVKNFLIKYTANYIDKYYNLISSVSQEEKTLDLPKIDNEKLSKIKLLLLENTKRSNYIIPECSHPLTILGSAYLFAKSFENKKTEGLQLLALPTGSTELAIVTKKVLEQKKIQNQLFFAPISLHNGNGEINFSSLDNILSGSEVTLIDDNVSSGKTLQTVKDELTRRGVKIAGYLVAEADLIRAKKRNTNPNTDYFQYSTNILPISQKIAPGNDLKKHGQRFLKYLYYQKQAKEAAGSKEKILFRVKAGLVKIPTDKQLKRSSEMQKITQFRDTFLSNFYPTQINFCGISFDCTETAYQYSKFKDLPAPNLAQEFISELNNLITSRDKNELLLSENMNWEKLLSEIFKTSSYSPGTVKHLSAFLESKYKVSDWFKRNKLQIMIELNSLKFEDLKLRQALLSTNDKLLVEGNSWNDTYWGFDLEKKEGLNYFGRILMELREQLKTENAPQ